MERSFADLLDALDGAGTPDDAWRAGTGWLVRSGVAWCHYAYTSNREEPAAGRLIQYSSLPQVWLDHYAEQRFFLTDPAVRHCTRADTPLLTGVESPERGSAAWRRGKISSAAVSAAVSPYRSGHLVRRLAASLY
jgi:hypothetical protein